MGLRPPRELGAGRSPEHRPPADLPAVKGMVLKVHDPSLTLAPFKSPVSNFVFKVLICFIEEDSLNYISFKVLQNLNLPLGTHHRWLSPEKGNPTEPRGL